MNKLLSCHYSHNHFLCHLVLLLFHRIHLFVVKSFFRPALSLFAKVSLAPDRDTAVRKKNQKGCGTKQRAAAFSRFHTLL